MLYISNQHVNNDAGVDAIAVICSKLIVLTCIAVVIILIDSHIILRRNMTIVSIINLHSIIYSNL